MWYNLNFNQLALQLLPTALRKPVLATFAQLLLKPLDSLYYRWYHWREDTAYKLAHNGQVCYLEKSLNDKFDPIERRIYIGEGNIYDTLYIYTESEAQDKHVHTEAEIPVLYLRTEEETADTGLDFIVWVPIEVYNIHYHGLFAHVDFYKAGGKRYNILTINE